MLRRGAALVSLGVLLLLLANFGSGANQNPAKSADSRAGDTLLAQAPAQAQPPSPTPPPAEGAPRSGRQTMIEALRGLLDGQTEGIDDEQRERLGQQLDQTNRTWLRLKADMRESIRQMNRDLPMPRHKKPNIVLITASDMGFGDIGAYGQKRIATPNLDRMSAEGMRFTKYYAGSDWPAPGRVSLLTGLDTAHIAQRGDAPPLPAANYATVADVLWKAGYRTGMVGYWPLGDETTTSRPSTEGFDASYWLRRQRGRKTLPAVCLARRRKAEHPREPKQPTR